MSQKATILEEVPEITYRQLNYWTTTGYLRPRRTKPGSGHTCDYPPVEVLIARLMGRLVAVGLIPEAAHRVARAVAEGRPAELAPGIEVIVRGSS